MRNRYNVHFVCKCDKFLYSDNVFGISLFDVENGIVQKNMAAF